MDTDPNNAAKYVVRISSITLGEILKGVVERVVHVIVPHRIFLSAIVVLLGIGHR
jgi:hypothetical protein